VLIDLVVLSAALGHNEADEPAATQTASCLPAPSASTLAGARAVRRATAGGRCIGCGPRAEKLAEQYRQALDEGSPSTCTRRLGMIGKPSTNRGLSRLPGVRIRARAVRTRRPRAARLAALGRRILPVSSGLYPAPAGGARWSSIAAKDGWPARRGWTGAALRPWPMPRLLEDGGWAVRMSRTGYRAWHLFFHPPRRAVRSEQRSLLHSAATPQ